MCVHIWSYLQPIKLMISIVQVKVYGYNISMLFASCCGLTESFEFKAIPFPVVLISLPEIRVA